MRKKRVIAITVVCLLVVLCAAAVMVSPAGRFIKAGLIWKIGDILDAYDKRFRLPKREILSGTPDRHREVAVANDVAVPMRDGVVLRANVYLPKAAGRWPAVVIRLPYGKDEPYCYMPAIGKFFARKGYACVVQDVRGKFGSGGSFEFFVNEGRDGYDTIGWIASQPWCDGRVGMYGESYYGYATWAAAMARHPNLKCIVPSTISLDLYGAVFRAGAFCLQAFGTYPVLMNARTYKNILRLDMRHLPLISLDDDAGIPSDYYKELVRHPTRDGNWKKYSLNDRYHLVDVPSLHLAGWYDNFLAGTMADWKNLCREAAGSPHEGKHWLMVGPWDHEYTTDRTRRVGRIPIGHASDTAKWDTVQLFFDRYLKGIKNGFEKRPPVSMFVIGPNEWRFEKEWPPAGVVYTEYYLHSRGKANTSAGDGRLDTAGPGQEPADRFVYDPADPVSVTLGVNLWMKAEQLPDRAEAEGRKDVLVYTTGPLAGDMEITGPITMELYASSSARDTDFTAALVDVFPDGYTHLLQEGIVRASYRASDVRPAPIEPGRIYRYSIDLWSTSHVVKKGHRIRVEISSSNFDMFDRNLNTGEPFGTSTRMEKARQAVYHSADFPSRVVLPVIGSRPPTP